MVVLDRGVVDRKQGKGERSQKQSIAKDVSPPSDPTIAPPRWCHLLKFPEPPLISAAGSQIPRKWAFSSLEHLVPKLRLQIITDAQSTYQKAQAFQSAVLRELNVQKQRDKFVFLGQTGILKGNKEGSRRECSDVSGKEK